MNTIKNEQDVIERINSIADVLSELGEEDQDVVDYRKLTMVFDSEHHLVNYMLAILIVKALNEKRVPDWNDGLWNKWFLWFFMGGSSGFRCDGFGNWGSNSDVGSRLCFMEKRLGTHAASKPEFMRVFENFMTIKQ